MQKFFGEVKAAEREWDFVIFLEVRKTFKYTLGKYLWELYGNNNNIIGPSKIIAAEERRDESQFMI